MYDPYGNKSTLDLIIKGEAPKQFLQESIDFELDQIDYRIKKDILKIYTSNNCEKEEEEELNLNIGGTVKTIKPSYFLDKTAVYLWKLHDGIPESALNCKKGLNFRSIYEIFPGKASSISTEKMKLDFGTYSLFDTLYLETAYEIKSRDSLEIFSLDPFTTPLKSSITIELSPFLNHYNPEKSHVYKTDDSGNFAFNGGEWKDNKIIFSTRELADYTILQDTEPPVITETNGSFQYLIKDELSGIKSYEATLNGNWILMKYEPKDNLIWIDWPNEEISKKGDLVIKVKDNADNEAEYITKL
jgi:hypothetical protein